MPDFNPANAIFRYSSEAVKGVPRASGSTYKDALIRTEGLTNTNDLRNDSSLYSGAQQPEGVDGKKHAGGPIEASMRPVEYTRWIASMQTKHTTTNPGTLAYLHKMFPSGATDSIDTFTGLISRDDGLPQRFLGARPGNMSFTVSKEGDGGILAISFEVKSVEGDYWPFATVVAGSGADDPTLRGIPPYAMWTDADAAERMIFVKITDVTNIGAAIPNVQVVAKIGTAATYGATETTVYIGVNSDTGLPYYNELLDSNGTGPIGGDGNALRVHFPTVTSLAVNDAWSWTDARTVWSPSNVDIPAFNEVQARIFVDGDAYCIDEFTLEVGQELEEVFCIGGRVPDEIVPIGTREVTLEMSRRYRDLSLRKKLETGQTMSFRADFYTKDFIEGTTKYRFSIIAANVKLSGPTASVESPDEFIETITGTCHPSSDVTYPDDVVFEALETGSSIAT